MRHRLVLKTLGISLFMWAFFVAYFHLLRHPAYPVVQMPLTALDHAIPFQPGALAAYVSLWVYVGAPPGLMRSLRELVAFGCWAFAMCLVGLAVFYFFPTAVPSQVVGVDLAEHPAFSLLQGVDAAGNACPSMHVAAAMFSVIWWTRLLRDLDAPRVLHALNLLWFALIVHSTLAIKQHVAWDVLAGAVLGAVFAWASLRWRPGRLGPAAPV
jgi:membrane-associated phospholipid phosphatase